MNSGDDDDIILLSDSDDEGRGKQQPAVPALSGRKEDVEEKKDVELHTARPPTPEDFDDLLYFGSDDNFADVEQYDMGLENCVTSGIKPREQSPIALKATKRVHEEPEADDQPTKSDEVAPKRKKRTKEEIEQDKLEKEINKIRRQNLLAKNSKCEQYLFCHFSSRILSLDDQLKDEIRRRFQERDIPNQIVYDNSTGQMMRIVWRRKRLDASLDDGKLVSKETMELQSHFCCVLSGDTFGVLAKTKNGLLDYLKDVTASHKTKEASPTLIVLGKHKVRDNAVDSLVFEAYERHKAQVRFVQDALDFSFTIVQMHRALAKLEKKTEKQMEAESIGTEGNHFLAEKGIPDGPEMVADWWAKMLDHIQRLSDEQKRAIVKAHPNPVKLMDRLTDPTNSPGNSMFQLSEIGLESGRRMGPVLAQRIYKVLTSLDGEEVIDQGGGS